MVPLYQKQAIGERQVRELESDKNSQLPLYDSQVIPHLCYIFRPKTFQFVKPESQIQTLAHKQYDRDLLR